MSRPPTITVEQRAAIPALRERGLSERQIAEQIGISRSLVHYHLNAESVNEKRKYNRTLGQPSWVRYGHKLMRRWPSATKEQLKHMAWLLEEASRT